MKKLTLLLITLLSWLISFSQIQNLPAGTIQTVEVFRLLNPTNLTNRQIWVIHSNGLNDRLARYQDITALSTGTQIPGGPITSIPTLGFNPGTNVSVSAWIQAAFYSSMPPLATLTGGVTSELTAASTATFSLSWGASRQSATNTLSSIVITGNSSTYTETFSQPSQPGTVSGTQSVTIPTNTTTTFTNTVTTSDSKVAIATTIFTYSPKRYWGRGSHATPTAGDIIAAVGGGNAFSIVHSGTFSITASGSNYDFVAWPSNEGSVTSIFVNGLDQTGAFNSGTLSFTNALGYIQNYNYIITNSTTNGDASITTN